MKSMKQTQSQSKLTNINSTLNQTPCVSMETHRTQSTLLKTNSHLALEIGVHTNSLPPDDFCDKLSTKRAKSVVYYLNRSGISIDRMSYRGYGKRKPIGDNNTKDGQRKNQRVEFIITDLD